METMTSLPPQHPTTDPAKLEEVPPSSVITQESPSSALGPSSISVSSCASTAGSPEAMKSAQHQHEPVFLSTPEATQRKHHSEVHTAPQKDLLTGVTSIAKSVTPSTVFVNNSERNHADMSKAKKFPASMAKTATGHADLVDNANVATQTLQPLNPASAMAGCLNMTSHVSSGSLQNTVSSIMPSNLTTSTIQTKTASQRPSRLTVDTTIPSLKVEGDANTNVTNSTITSTRTLSSATIPAPKKQNTLEPSATATVATSKIMQSHSKPKGAKTEQRTTTPVPPTNSSRSHSTSRMRTPVRSPRVNGSTFQAFNSDIPNFASPSIFLSPYLPSLPDALDKKTSSFTSAAMSGKPTGAHSGPEDRRVAGGGITPTNFATDFGKHDLNDDNLNNVLPWLSPNAYGLFSPTGGLTASITPSGLNRTPNPNALTDDAQRFSLPFDKKEAGGGLMICVSPLARKNGSVNKTKQPETPINFHDVFASPKGDGRSKFQTAASNEIPTITDSNDKVANLSLQKHLAERDIMEDEDLNVLLKLAETTPRRQADGKGSSGTRVFRGAGGSFAYPASQPVGPPPFLHLPIIAKTSGSSAKKGGAALTAGAAKKAPPKKRKNAQGKGAAAKVSTKAAVSGHPMPSHQPPGYYPPYSMHTSAPYPYSYATNGRNAHPPPPYMYPNVSVPAGAETVKGLKKKSAKTAKTASKATAASTGTKRSMSTTAAANKKSKKSAGRGRGPGKKKAVHHAASGQLDKQKAAETISAINSASGKKNDKAASLASAILRGVTMRPSGKWQAQLYFAGKSRYIGVFDSREKAALAYEIAREHLQNKSVSGSKDTDAHVNAARKAAFEGVNEKDPRHNS